MISRLTNKYADFKESLAPAQLMFYRFICLIVFVLLYIVDGYFGLTFSKLLGEISFGGVICFSYVLIMMLLNVSYMLRRLKWWQVLICYYIIPISFVVAFVGFYDVFFVW